MNYVLIVFDKKNNKYDVIQRREVKDMAESFGFRYNNETIDSYVEGDKIQKDTMLYRSPALDEHENFRFGVNAKVIYLISQNTLEDAGLVRRGFADKLSFTKVETFRIPLNDNDIPLNMYGDNKEYKICPNIGEYTNESIVCATRRKDNRTSQYTMKNSNLRKLFPNDDVYQTYGEYQIVDMNIWCNKDIDKIPDTQAYSQLKSQYKDIYSYNEEMYEKLGKIIEDSEIEGYTYSAELSRLYAGARDFLDPHCKYTENDRMFSNMVIEFTMCKSQSLASGSKISGLFGNKMVCGEIRDDDLMPISEDGITADIVMDALSVVARLNGGQNYVHELNACGELVRTCIQQVDDNEYRIKLLITFLEKANKEYAYEVEEAYNELSTEEERNEFFYEIIKDRIYIKQEPLQAISGDRLKDMEDELCLKPTTIYMGDADGEFKFARKCIIADEYIIVLKHIAQSKFSVRSKGEMDAPYKK